MTQESGGADPHINPPSFIPAGNRRTRPSGQVPRSFAPARTSRQSGQAPSARPSVTGNDIEEHQLNANATASANVADNGRRTSAQFFSENRTRHSQHGSGCRRTAQHPPSRARMSSAHPQRRAQSVGYAGFPALIASSKRVHEVQPSWPAGGGNGENCNGTPAARLAQHLMRDCGAGGGVDSFRFRCLAMGGQQTESERLADRHPQHAGLDLADSWLR